MTVAATVPPSVASVTAATVTAISPRIAPVTPLLRKASRNRRQPGKAQQLVVSGQNGGDAQLKVEDPDTEAAAARELLAVAGPWRDGPAAARSRLFKWYQRGRLPFYHFRDVPRYLQDNPQILTGYRAGYTYRENWISLCHLHNESVNVWTHVAGFLIFSLTAAAVALDALRSASWSGLDLRDGSAPAPWVQVGDARDKLVLSLFLLSCSFTYITSAMYHLHMSHSQHACTTFGCWDYSGISAGVLGTSSAVLQFLFTCDPTTRARWQLAVLVANTLGVVGPVFPFWATAAFRPKRAALYLASAAVSMCPIAHYITRYGFAALPDPRAYFAAPGFAAGLGVYFVGVTLYVRRLPEKLAPGLFDFFGQSHQIWHLLCVVAGTVHAQVVLSLMAWKADGGPGC